MGNELADLHRPPGRNPQTCRACTVTASTNSRDGTRPQSPSLACDSAPNTVYGHSPLTQRPMNRNRLLWNIVKELYLGPLRDGVSELTRLEDGEPDDQVVKQTWAAFGRVKEALGQLCPDHPKISLFSLMTNANYHDKNPESSSVRRA